MVTLEFLRMVVGLDTEYIVRRPTLLGSSMKNHLVPQNYILKVLKTKGFVNKNIDVYGVVKMSEKRFTMSFIECYSVTISRLEGAYAVLVQGKFLPKSSSESLEWRC